MNSGNRTAYEFHVGVRSCSGEYSSPVPCVRAVATGTLALATLCACCFRLWCAFKVKADRREHYFVICFGLAVIELCILSYRWIIGGDTAEHFGAIYLHVLQFLLLIVYYTERVLKVNKQGYLIRRLCYPIAAMIFIYFTAVLVLAVTYRYSDSEECQSLAWILFSGSMTALAALFIALGVLLTRAMNNFPTSDPTLVWWTRFHLWVLIAAYSLASVAELGFDLAFAYLTDKNEDCDGVYGGPSSFGYTLYIVVERLSLLGPVWVMLAVLKCGATEAKLNESQDRGASISVFRPSGSTGSLDSAVHWDTDNYDINGVFDDEPETAGLLVASSPTTYKSYD